MMALEDTPMMQEVLARHQKQDAVEAELILWTAGERSHNNVIHDEGGTQYQVIMADAAHTQALALTLMALRS